MSFLIRAVQGDIRGLQSQDASLLHGISRIHGEIHHDLIDLRRRPP